MRPWSVSPLPFSLIPLCLDIILSIGVLAAAVLSTPSCSSGISSRKKRGNFCHKFSLTSDLTGQHWIPDPVNSKGKRNTIHDRLRLMRNPPAGAKMRSAFPEAPGCVEEAKGMAELNGSLVKKKGNECWVSEQQCLLRF